MSKKPFYTTVREEEFGTFLCADIVFHTKIFMYRPEDTQDTAVRSIYERGLARQLKSGLLKKLGELEIYLDSFN